MSAAIKIKVRQVRDTFSGRVIRAATVEEVRHAELLAKHGRVHHFTISSEMGGTVQVYVE